MVVEICWPRAPKDLLYPRPLPPTPTSLTPGLDETFGMSLLHLLPLPPFTALFRDPELVDHSRHYAIRAVRTVGTVHSLRGCIGAPYCTAKPQASRTTVHREYERRRKAKRAQRPRGAIRVRRKAVVASAVE